MSEKIKNKPDAKLVRRVAFLVLMDIIIALASAFLALLLRFEFDVADEQFIRYGITAMQWMIPNIAVTVLVFCAFKLYTSIWAFAGADELIHLFFSAAAVCIVQYVSIGLGLRMPRSFPIMYAIFFFIMTVLLRFSYRFMRRLKQPRTDMQGQRTMVIGAGEAAAAVLKEFKVSKYSRNHVVCLIDDDPAKQSCSIMGVPVVGGREMIERVAKQFHIDEIVFAIPTISQRERKKILTICQRTGCKLKQLPGIYQLANGEVSIQKIRDVDIVDLLGRDVVEVDSDGILDHVKGKTVMVTGGGGSIGSELCRQLASFEPAALIIFDIYENNAYSIEQELRRTYPDLTLHTIIGSVRDEKRINSVMETYRPHMVFHAAAHKHVPLMETSPMEAVKNNVFGTYNTAKAASRYGVKKFVLISTDKAVNPTNIMGATQRICEMVVQMMDGESETCFAAVRFGNVLGSNGSVIPLFREQIKNGGPVTVTHPEITRFFMTIPEAVSLVLQAGAFARGGEIFVLDMGSPVKIDELARNMIKLSGFEPDVDIHIEYTGLRPGEKLYEELLMDEEGLSKTANDLIYIGQKIPFDTDTFKSQLTDLGELASANKDAVRDMVREIVPTYQPKA